MPNRNRQRYFEPFRARSCHYPLRFARKRVPPVFITLHEAREMGSTKDSTLTFNLWREIRQYCEFQVVWQGWEKGWGDVHPRINIWILRISFPYEWWSGVPAVSGGTASSFWSAIDIDQQGVPRHLYSMLAIHIPEANILTPSLPTIHINTRDRRSLPEMMTISPLRFGRNLSIWYRQSGDENRRQFQSIIPCWDYRVVLLFENSLIWSDKEYFRGAPCKSCDAVSRFPCFVEAHIHHNRHHGGKGAFCKEGVQEEN